MTSENKDEIMTIEPNKIYNMDCLEGMKQIPDGSIDAIICDLPYGTTANKWDSIIPLDQLWAQYKRIIKKGGPIVLFAQCPFDKVLGCSNLAWLKYQWVWEKDNVTGFLQANKMPLRIHEVILVFCQDSPIYNPQGLVYNPKKMRRGRVGDNYGTTTKNEYETEYENYPRDLQYFPKDSDSFHPTQKPVDLLRYLVKTYTNEGDTILDNCMGSGTTAVACIKEKRHFIGFELNKEYYDKACLRIDAVKRQLTLF
jgi:site-specific DNA-methyltransferase (adenine-specific)